VNNEVSKSNKIIIRPGNSLQQETLVTL